MGHCSHQALTFVSDFKWQAYETLVSTGCRRIWKESMSLVHEPRGQTSNQSSPGTKARFFGEGRDEGILYWCSSMTRASRWRQAPEDWGRGYQSIGFFFFSRTLEDPHVDLCGLSRDPARRQIAPIVQSTGETDDLIRRSQKGAAPPKIKPWFKAVHSHRDRSIRSLYTGPTTFSLVSAI